MAAKSRKEKTDRGPVAVNKKAYRNYELIERFEAGLSLLGAEVKSLRAGQADLAGSYARVESGQGWLVGAKIHSARTIQKMKTKHMKDQKNLYSQYYNDVYKLQQQNAELAYVVEQYQDAIHNVAVEMDNDQLKRDYDEFKQPDVDGDDRISRAEFSMYVKNYLSNYPGLTEKDYPRFEDFDHDGDGFIGFQEYAQQMALTIQKAEQDKSSKLTY